MKNLRAIAVVASFLSFAAVWCYLDLRLSPYPVVQGRALNSLWNHLQVFTAPLSVAALIGCGALSLLCLRRAWHFALMGAVVTPPALLPWAYSGSSGESFSTLALAVSVIGVPLGAAFGLLLWKISRRSAVQLSAQPDAGGGTAASTKPCRPGAG